MPPHGRQPCDHMGKTGFASRLLDPVDVDGGVTDANLPRPILWFCCFADEWAQLGTTTPLQTLSSLNKLPGERLKLVPGTGMLFHR